MTREEADFIGAMNMCDEISNEAYKKIMCHCEEQEPCEDSISRKTVLSKFKEVCFSEEWLQFRADNGSNGQRDFLINYIEQLPPVTPQPETYTNIPLLLHKEFGCPLDECVKAYEEAIKYLRSKSKLKG